MPRPIDPSRDLLFGLLALQTGLINQAQLVAGFHCWTQAADRRMAEILAEQGGLDTHCLALVEGLVNEHLRRHGDDVERSLAGVGVSRSTREGLAQIANPDLDASLAHVGSGSTEDENDPDRTASYNVGTSTSDGQRFRVLRPHAQGGLGAVFVALDTELHREVALKQILDDHADDPVNRQRFLLEAEITGGLEHPGIIPVYGLGTYGDGRPYYAMRFIRGDTLKRAIERFHADRGLRGNPGRSASGGLELRKLLRRFLDACNAIDYAHSRGVLHRDIKPGNVLLGRHGETLMVDWGLAKTMGKSELRSEERTLVPSSALGNMQTLPGSALGTPAYMSPEQAEGNLDRLGPRSDVYSLGATLYCVLTGRPPFVGNPGEVRRAVQQGEFPSPRAIDPTVDRALEAVCLKAMAPRPEDRYDSCRALADDLERWMADEPVSAWREPITRRLRRWARRHRPTVTGAAVALVAGSIGLAAAATIYLQERHAQAGRLDLALREVNLLRGQALADPEGDPVKWHAALQAVKRAQDLLGPLIDTALQRRVRLLGDQVAISAQAAERDARLVREAVDIRSAEADDPDGSVSDAAYARAFRDAEIDLDKLGPEVAGAKIRGRPVGVALAMTAVLDEWAARRRRARPTDTEAWKRLVATARAADSEPTRDRLRRLWSEPDRKAQRQPLIQLAKEADPRSWPPTSLMLLSGALDAVGEREAAADLLRRAQAEHPGDVWVNYYLARFLEGFHTPRTEEAIRYYSVARALRPETAHELAHALEAQHREDEAVVVFRDLTRLRSESPRHWFCLGRLLKKRGDREIADGALEKAAATIRQAIRLRPDTAADHGILGNVLSSQGKLDLAVVEFREAIRLRPNDPEIHADLGRVLRDQGKLDEAISEYREVIRLDPADSHGHYNLAAALSDLGMLDKAIAEYRESIRLHPAAAGAHYNLGRALGVQGKPAEAMTEYREVIRLTPDHAEAHTNLGGILCDIVRDYEAAAAEFRTAIRIKPDLVEAHANLGIALERQGKLTEAITAFRDAIRLQPGDAGTHFSLARVLGEHGKPAEAMIEYREVIRLQPDDALARYSLAGFLLQQRKPVEAMTEYREVIRLKPDYAEAHCNLGSALKAIGRYGEALTEFRRGHDLGSKQPGWSYPSAEWVHQAERMAALESRFLAALHGDDKPKDAAEGLDFAHMAYTTKRFHASARLYAESFGADPNLAGNVTAGHRYAAACAAALAAAGKGVDQHLLSGPEKARWRKQAVEWLRADLVFRTRQVETGKPESAAMVSHKLQHWKADSALGGIRDETAIRALPDDEERACKALWAEVDALLATSGAGSASRPHP
jgi:tetratricopeptide (TPR) repeat protein